MAPLSFTGLTDDQLRAIGRVATEWNDVEYVIDYAIWKLAGLRHDEGRCITQHVVSKVKDDMLLALMHEAHGASPLYNEMKALRIAIERARGARNRVIHREYETAAQTGTSAAVRWTARGRLELAVEYPSAADIDAIADAILDLRDRLSAVVNRLGGPSPSGGS